MHMRIRETRGDIVICWNMISILPVGCFVVLLVIRLIYVSVTLALWEPSPVQLGDVGYLLKPKGTFVTLFNSLKHQKAAGFIGGLPSMAGYGNVSRGTLRLDKRNVAQKGLDVFSGLLTFRARNEVPISFVFSLYLWTDFLTRISVDDTLSGCVQVTRLHIFTVNPRNIGRSSYVADHRGASIADY